MRECCDYVCRARACVFVSRVSACSEGWYPRQRHCRTSCTPCTHTLTRIHTHDRSERVSERDGGTETENASKHARFSAGRRRLTAFVGRLHESSVAFSHESPSRSHRSPCLNHPCRVAYVISYYVCFPQTSFSTCIRGTLLIHTVFFLCVRLR